MQNGRVNTRRQISCTVFQVTQPIKIPTVNDSAVWRAPLRVQENLQEADSYVDHHRIVSVHQHLRKPSTTFQQLLQEKSRDDSNDSTFTKFNSRQNSVIEQQLAVTVIKKPKIYEPSPTSTINYASQPSNNQNKFTKYDASQFYSQKVKDLNGCLENVREIKENVPNDFLIQQLSNRNNLGSLLSERQKINKNIVQAAQIPKKLNNRCMSMDAQHKRRIVKTPEQSFLMCDEQILVEESTGENPGCYQQETLQYLMLSELDQQIDPEYLRKHPSLTFHMRTVLMDWMMEVCSEFTLKRETYHIAVGLVDKYLSATQGKQQKQLQLVGVSAMLVAAKIEEIYPPSPTKFAESADYGYSIEQILQMEVELLSQLKWQTTFPTMNLWMNWYCGQWDLFIRQPQYQFKQPTEEAYQLFRQLSQLIDCATLDIDFLKARPRQLIAAFMYLTLAVRFKYMTVKIIQEKIPSSSQFLMDSSNNFNALFCQFALFNFGFNMPDLLPSIQYCARFFHLQFNYEVPEALLKNQEGHYEELLSYQTHNSHNIQCLKLKRRQ